MGACWFSLDRIHSTAGVPAGLPGTAQEAEAIMTCPILPPIRGAACAAVAVAILCASAAAQDLTAVDDGGGLLSLCLATRPPATPWAVWWNWSFAPVVVVPLILLPGLVWVPGSRGHRGGASRIKGACFAGGWALLAIALVSPLCRMAATLAWAHMVQHVILVALAPALLVLGAPRVRPLRGWGRRAAGRPAAAGILYAAAIWISHLPAVYQAALGNATVHVAVVCGLLAVSLFFWRAALDPLVDPGAASGGAASVALLSAMIQTGGLGALLAFSPTAWYPVFAGRAEAWGLTPLEDQQLAGLIMWVPMGAIYLGAALAVTTALVFRRRPPPPLLPWR